MSMTKFGVPAVVYRTPVPSDIEVSQSITPAHIGKIAESVGVLPSTWIIYTIVNILCIVYNFLYEYR